MIAFFGTGLLGAGFTRALLARGEQVNVWNRTREKARALEADGARAFDDPREAARGAERVHLSLSDDAAVDAVLERAAFEGVIVDHTTTSAEGARRRSQRYPRFVHAPVFMGPQNARDATGLMLVSGERARVDAVRPHLEKMTGKVVELGERPEEAAAFKLLGNLFLMFVTSGLAETFTLGRALGIEPRDAAKLFDHFNPGLTLGARIDRMLGGDFTKASWELGMARKDARLMLEAADLPVLPAIAARMDTLISRGHAKDDWTVLAKDALG